MACASVGLLAAPATRADAPAAPASAASAPPTAASGPALERVEISGRRSDTEQRRQATAAKIVVGREELEKFGDSTLGEVLRRLPGVTQPGALGRGGAPRLRGLGGGYTQILIDGQRVPPGFSFDSINPDQIERIEVQRAPTAETGARAIAGTIHIITREGFRRRLNEWKVDAAAEGSRGGAGVGWTRNDSAGPLTYNVSLSMRAGQRITDTVTRTSRTQAADGSTLATADEAVHTSDRSRSLNLTSRLQWRLGQAGETLLLQPTLFWAGTRVARSAAATLTEDAGQTALLPYASARGEGDYGHSHARLNAQWRGRLAEALRFELSGSVARFESDTASERSEFDGGGALLRTVRDDARSRQSGGNLIGKLSTTLEDGSNLVGGLELEQAHRTQTRTTLENGTPLMTDFGDQLDAASLRSAAFIQNEWAITPQWSANAGLRWEGITTQGQLPDGSRPRNRSSVWTPLAHALWKPDPKGPDQLRIGLTRSYRSPDLGQLIARPTLSANASTTGPNAPTSPDRAGNPDLRPELATGLDVALERYLEQGGLLSANVFVRRIRDLIRNVVAQETVSWSSSPRWVSRPQNIGDATTAGLELEARGRLDQWLGGAPPTELRSNLSVFTSRVDNVPGPDNRLSEQPRGSANLGFDHRLRGTPLSFGGNFNWTPGYRTRLAEDRWVEAGTKRVLDAYALWTFSPAAALRLLAGNLGARDYVASTT
ncbi:MAG TPA: TonB-dependent receptor, partial [Burkholderiaceae bacterium]|nr:TonB-dependent receptor [Burkholderiaceae bacterium]